MPARAETGPATPAPIWLVDWSDSEQEDFLAACAGAGVEARVIRGPALGSTVGNRLHRLRSWPAYLSLAWRGLHARPAAPLVAWQPIAGALAGLMRRRRRPGLVVLNPLVDPDGSSLRQRLLLAGARRADRVLFFSSSALAGGLDLGLERERARFVPLGVRAALGWRPPSANYLLAVGREERDWVTLARAAEGLSCELRVVGPTTLTEPSPLRLLPQLERPRLLELMREARAVVVPLLPGRRPAGQLTVLDAMSVGRAVVATRASGTEDYVDDETGILVPAGDEAALREALARAADRSLSEKMGRAALAAARGPFSLERFVAAVDSVARAL
jgi:glycosyltransferase involved in cell wall biosynthesis